MFFLFAYSLQKALYIKVSLSLFYPALASVFFFFSMQQFYFYLYRNYIAYNSYLF